MTRDYNTLIQFLIEGVKVMMKEITRHYGLKSKRKRGWLQTYPLN